MPIVVLPLFLVLAMAFRSVSVNSTPAVSPVVTAPSGIVDGDILIAFTLTDDSTGATTWPTGFVEGTGSPQTMSVYDASVFRYAIKVAASESGNYTLTTTTTSLGGMACFSGRVQSTTPHRSSATKADSSHASAWSITSAAFSSATTATCDILLIGNSDGVAPAGDVVHAGPAGYTVDSDFTGGTNVYQGLVAHKNAVASGETGALTSTGTLGGSSAAWSVFAIALADFVPSSTTLYLNNPVQASSNAGLLDTAAPTASTSTTGWTVGTVAINQYSRQTYNSEVPTTGFTGTAQPSGSPVNLGEDCFRLSTATTGTFSAGTWFSSVSVIAVSSGGIQQGRARFRVWRSSNADGTGATEITQGTMIGSQVTELNTSVAQTSSASTQVGLLVLSSEFLFQQIAWETL